MLCFVTDQATECSQTLLKAKPLVATLTKNSSIAHLGQKLCRLWIWLSHFSRIGWDNFSMCNCVCFSLTNKGRMMKNEETAVPENDWFMVVRLRVVTVTNMKSIILLDVTPQSLIDGCRCFRGTPVMKMEAAGSPGTLTHYWSQVCHKQKSLVNIQIMIFQTMMP